MSAACACVHCLRLLNVQVSVVCSYACPCFVCLCLCVCCLRPRLPACGCLCMCLYVCVCFYVCGLYMCLLSVACYLFLLALYVSIVRSLSAYIIYQSVRIDVFVSVCLLFLVSVSVNPPIMYVYMLAHISSHAFICLCYLPLNFDMKVLGGIKNTCSCMVFVSMLIKYACSIFWVPAAHCTSVNCQVI